MSILSLSRVGFPSRFDVVSPPGITAQSEPLLAGRCKPSELASTVSRGRRCTRTGAGARSDYTPGGPGRRRRRTTRPVGGARQRRRPSAARSDTGKTSSTGLSGSRDFDTTGAKGSGQGGDPVPVPACRSPRPCAWLDRAIRLTGRMSGSSSAWRPPGNPSRGPRARSVPAKPPPTADRFDHARAGASTALHIPGRPMLQRFVRGATASPALVNRIPGSGPIPPQANQHPDLGEAAVGDAELASTHVRGSGAPPGRHSAASARRRSRGGTPRDRSACRQSRQPASKCLHAVASRRTRSAGAEAGFHSRAPSQPARASAAVGARQSVQRWTWARTPSRPSRAPVPEAPADLRRWSTVVEPARCATRTRTAG